MAKLILFLSIFLVSFYSVANIDVSEKNWPLWETFKANFITDEGRVIDPYDGKNITTSEGQSYALFFSLINNEPKTFDRILTWTNKRLAPKGLANQLPAWQYGGKTNRGKILDANSATDSDLWIIYSLLEAADLWQKPAYRKLAENMAEQLLSKATIKHDKFGLLLLPAPEGFVKESHITLNLSYYPLQVLAALSHKLSDHKWKDILNASVKLTLAASNRGLAPDWFKLSPEGTIFDYEKGGYEAIRTYIWHNTLNPHHHFSELIAAEQAKAAVYLSKIGYMPEYINTSIFTYNGWGNIGMQAALLPMMQRYGFKEMSQQISQQMRSSNFTELNNYYSHALSLFVAGYTEQRYRFDGQGTLLLPWSK